MGRQLQLVVTALGVAACGRINFDPFADPTADAPVDIALDGTALTGCWPRWHAATIRFSPPELLTFGTGDPSLARGDRTLYFVLTEDLKLVTRQVPTGNYTSPISDVVSLSSALADYRVTMTGDDLIAILASSRGGGNGGFDLWMSERATDFDPFPMPDQVLLGALNDNADQFDPELSPDGLRLYYAPSSGPDQLIMLSTRPSRTSAFAAGVPIGELNITSNVADPTISPDELVIVMSVAASSSTPSDLQFSTRASRNVPFSAPALVPDVNTAARESDPELSADGCELYLVSLVGGPQEMYIARAL